MTNNRYETMRNMTLLPKFINIDNYKGKLCTHWLLNIYLVLIDFNDNDISKY